MYGRVDPYCPLTQFDAPIRWIEFLSSQYFVQKHHCLFHKYESIAVNLDQFRFWLEYCSRKDESIFPGTSNRRRQETDFGEQSAPILRSRLRGMSIRVFAIWRTKAFWT
jgi:hypothetical protein